MKNKRQQNRANRSGKQQTALQRTVFDVPRTECVLQQNAGDGAGADNGIGSIQPFALPVVYKKQAHLLQQQT